MRRRLLNFAVALSLLLSLAAAAAWMMSYARPLGWHLAGTAHSADLTRAALDRRTAVLMLPIKGPDVPPYGYWDALWVRSESGRLSLVAQAADYEGNLRALYASPPSLLIDLPGPERPRAAAFARMPDSRPSARWLGFAWHADAQQAVDDNGGGHVSARARMIMLPYWFIILIALPLPLWWLRARR